MRYANCLFVFIFAKTIMLNADDRQRTKKHESREEIREKEGTFPITKNFVRRGTFIPAIRRLLRRIKFFSFPLPLHRMEIYPSNINAINQHRKNEFERPPISPTDSRHSRKKEMSRRGDPASCDQLVNPMYALIAIYYISKRARTYLLSTEVRCTCR